MIEVSKTNFKHLYPTLSDAIDNASFISIDAEFTGINTEEDMKHSFFDTLEDRYNTLRRNIRPFIIIQFGITTFRHDPEENAYIARCFNFHLFPRPVPFNNRQFSCQATALEFLDRHNSNFSKVISEGISYLNEIEEKLLKEHIEQGNILNSLEHLTYEEEDYLKESKKKAFDWITNDSNEALFKVETSNPFLQYVLHKELRSSFDNIWTLWKRESVYIVKVPKKTQIYLKKHANNNIEDILLKTCIGFSKVFKLLSSCKKPIVGHNMLLDLMFIYQQFYKPLPDSYKEFKDNIHSLFPQIYDTKLLSFKLRKLLKRDEVTWKQNSLSLLYEFFTSKQGKHLVFNSPQIEFSTKNLGFQHAHNAGWDAYCTGYIFVKMGHMFSIQKYGQGLEERAVTHSELMSAIKDFVNSVNITRGNEMYMKFGGPDPTVTRPEWLYVKVNSPYIDTKQVS
ncbi:Poly(A)-specific ribonuclease PARN-like domain-containing protein 1 [Habropoda laboriosa]|uniref:Poly(A)-specific ribonuclease PARN-like domain-containing protein 1 n=1 Tax=Habropoda laboriosa TaxID=597456 RepID=A0A0L7R9Y6_9HYME|nr:Poly(A)-specific ribonuclease PARN-like domain-containing protein 1 [Habropoda laboriosa]